MAGDNECSRPPGDPTGVDERLNIGIVTAADAELAGVMRFACSGMLDANRVEDETARPEDCQGNCISFTVLQAILQHCLCASVRAC